MKLKAVILLSLFSSLLMLCAAEEVSKVRPVETPAINLWVDTLLGVISEDEEKEKMKSLRPDFKTALQSETAGLTGDLYGVRQVSGRQFAALVDKIDEITSFSSTQIVGKTGARAYLEVKIFLTSSKGYVAIVCAPLDDLPVATRKKF